MMHIQLHLRLRSEDLLRYDGKNEVEERAVEILTTARLALREMVPSDAGFMVEIMNEKPFLEHVGDKGVRNPAAALAYMEERYFQSYQKYGYGFWHVRTKHDDTAIGVCGLIKRPDLAAPDIGYGLLEAHWGKGYAVEAGRAVLDYARATLKLPKVVAMTGFNNQRSIRVLERLGMHQQGTVYVEGYPEGSLLFEWHGTSAKS